MALLRNLSQVGAAVLGCALFISANVTYAGDPVTRNDPRISGALPGFFGTHGGSYIEVGGSLLDQFNAVYWGVPGPALALPNGSSFLSASRRGAADEKAALILGADGKIKAAALVSYRCLTRGSANKIGTDVASQHKLHRRGDTLCKDDKDQTMTIFVKDGRLDAGSKKAFLEWKERIGKEILSIEPAARVPEIMVEQVMLS